MALSLFSGVGIIAFKKMQNETESLGYKFQHALFQTWIMFVFQFGFGISWFHKNPFKKEIRK